jgi:hypothetical protein
VVVVLTATSANAAGAGRYRVYESSGAFTPLTSYNWVPNESDNDDEVFYLATSASGPHRLPFALHLYNVTYRNLAISTNGNVQLGVGYDGGNDAYENDCLRSATITSAAVFPFWDDLLFHPSDTSKGYPQGVFTKTFGAAPHRTFVISWQGVLYDDENVPVEVQVAFREGSQNFTTSYGTTGGGTATIGVQSRPAQNRFTQYACDSGVDSVTSGDRLIWTHVN